MHQHGLTRLSEEDSHRDSSMPQSGLAGLSEECPQTGLSSAPPCWSPTYMYGSVSPSTPPAGARRTPIERWWSFSQKVHSTLKVQAGSSATSDASRSAPPYKKTRSSPRRRVGSPSGSWRFRSSPGSGSSWSAQGSGRRAVYWSPTAEAPKTSNESLPQVWDLLPATIKLTRMSARVLWVPEQDQDNNLELGAMSIAYSRLRSGDASHVKNKIASTECAWCSVTGSVQCEIVVGSYAEDTCEGVREMWRVVRCWSVHKRLYVSARPCAVLSDTC